MPQLDYSTLTVKREKLDIRSLKKDQLIIFGDFIRGSRLVKDGRLDPQLFPEMEFIGTPGKLIEDCFMDRMCEVFIVKKPDNSHILYYRPCISSNDVSIALECTMRADVDTLCYMHNTYVFSKDAPEIREEDKWKNLSYSSKEVRSKEMISLRKSSDSWQNTSVPMPCRSTRCIEF